MNGDAQALIDARKRELEGWERSRRNEVFLDLRAHFWRSAIGVIAALTVWQALNHFSVKPLSPWRFLVVSALAVYLLGVILFWLRIWGAYIERRLEEIEARIQGDEPSYYQVESTTRLLRNGLHDRLGRVEEKLDAVIRPVAHI